ncbi:MAG: riboflavin synthase [Gemmatimonadetes bacterium]|nr:riboflavin synthase [Gemmatimonadota bacterium]
MFTGIVEAVGQIVSISEVGDGRGFRIAAPTIADGLRPGDSVALDGACHTVVERFDGGFDVQSVATTLGRTTLGDFEEGRLVNMERALAVGDRLGGHLVQGHVDGTAHILSIIRQNELVLIDFSLPDAVAEVTILHGSITLNGISLTVNSLPSAGVCQVAIIPFTWEHTTARHLGVGDRINLEGDTIGKYVRHMLGAPARAGESGKDLRAAWGYQDERR